MVKQAEEEHPNKAFGWAARDTSGVLSPFHFSRRATGEKDVAFKLVLVGAPKKPLELPAMALIMALKLNFQLN